MKKPDIKNMTLRDKIAQTLLLRQHHLCFKTVDGKKVKRSMEEIQELMGKNQYGGLWVMGNFELDFEGLMSNSNVKKPTSDEYRTWIEQISKNLKIPLLTGLDGATGVFEDVSSPCSGRNVVAANSEQLAYELNYAVSKEIRSCGGNWHWHPVADVPTEVRGFPALGICGSVSDDPDTIIKFEKPMIKALNDAKLASTLKHFPGEDPNEYRDNHIITTSVESNFEDWWQRQGRVFKALIDSGVDAVMSSHVAFPAVDDAKVNNKYIPATLSYKIITGLLKEKMGFEGVVITDSIQMGGLSGYYSREQLVIECIKAGNDVLLSADVDMIDILEKAVLSGDIPEERIDDACRRILNLKEKLGMFEDVYQIGEKLTPEMLENTKRINQTIAEKSITLIRDNDNKLPLSKDKIKKVAVIISTHADFIVDRLDILKEEFEKRGARVYMQRRLSSTEELCKIAEDNDLILYATFLDAHAPKGAVCFFGEEFETFIHALSYGSEKSIGFSLGDPYIHYNFLTNVDTFVNTYVPTPECIRAMVAAFYGEIPFEGKSPVRLIP